jgi:hypothetical protein
VTTPRNRGPRWSSPKQVDRGRRLRTFSLSNELHARLDAERERGANLSSDAERALRLFYGMSEEDVKGGA